jgi:predicted PurR-regulated permease PerM
MTQTARLHQLNLVTLAAACALLWAFRSVLAPFTLAFVIAILIDASIRALGRRLPVSNAKSARVIAGAGVVGILLAGAAVLADGVARIAASIPRLLPELDRLVREIALAAGLRTPVGLQGLAAHLDAPALAAKTVGVIQDAVSGTGLVSLFLVFILACRPLIKAKLLVVASSDSAGRVLALLDRSVQGVETYAWIQTVTGLMIAAGSCAVMLALGLHDALFWAVLIFLFAYLPVVGVVLGGLGPALFALLQFPSAWPAILIFGGIQAVGMVVGNLILPKMQADSQNIDPAMSMVAVGIWSILWGVPGAFLAVPLTLALMAHLSQHENLRWLAILISNDGLPDSIAERSIRLAAAQETRTKPRRSSPEARHQRNPYPGCNPGASCPVRSTYSVYPPPYW